MLVRTDKELETIRKLIHDVGVYEEYHLCTYEERKALEKSLSVAYPENIGEPEV